MSYTPSKFLKSHHVNVVPCAFSGGQAKGGVDDGPAMLLNHGLLEQIKQSGWDVNLKDEVDVLALKPEHDPPIGVMKNTCFVSQVTERLSEVCASSAATGGLTLTVGGDHSLAIGTIVGLMQQYPEAVVLWIDAHADLNTPASTESGNIHGCPVSFVTGQAGPSASLPKPLQWIPACLDTSRLAYIGLRDIDPEERRIIRARNIAAYSMHHVDKYGIGTVVQMALDRINPNLTRPIHLSYDVDAIDPVFVSATGTPVRGGLTFREGTYICEAVAETGCLVSMDLVEVNPNLRSEGDAGQLELNSTLDISSSLVRCALGETLL
jgi:arginase